MILALQDATTSAVIGEMEADFVPVVGDTFIYHEGLPNETNYTIAKRLMPTLVRDSVIKIIRLRVRVST